MLKYFWILTVLLTLVPTLIQAQLEASREIFKARIVDCTSGRAIPYVDVFNESARRGVIADSTGFFRMYVHPGDTLVLQSMGYLGKVYFINYYTASKLDTLEICPQYYELGEVQVELPRSYEQFQQNFLRVEPDRGLQIEGLPKSKIQDIPVLLDTSYIESADFLFWHPLSYLYYNFSKYEKSNRKVFYLERQKREQVVIDKKFNRELIEKMTGLNGNEITDFISFCNFSHKFLYEATELEIVQMIDKKFEEYKILLPYK